MITKTANFKQNYKYLIFDFDGTINNTEPGIAQSFKKTLDIFGVDYSNVNFKRHIGPPLEFSFRELVGDDRWQEAVAVYRGIYDSDNASMNSHIYDGIDTVLGKLQAAGYILSVATSKYEPHAKTSLSQLNLAQYFHHVYGQTATRGYKNEILQQLIAENGFDKAQCLMIGDTAYDIDGARDNGIDVLAVTYGFETKVNLLLRHPDAVVDTPEEILQLILGK